MAEKETAEHQPEDPNQEDQENNIESFSEVFISELNATKKPLENKKVASVIDSFVLNLRESIEAFIGCKVHFAFQSVEQQQSQKFSPPSEINVLTSFSIANMTHYGLFGFGFEFLDPIVSILYGGGPSFKPSQTTGKAGLKVAEKLSSIAIGVFQNALQEITPSQFSLINTSGQSKTMLNRYLPEQFFYLRLKVSINERESFLHLIFPEMLFASILDEVGESHETINKPNSVPYSGEQFRKELIESKITLIAELDPIKMKINDVLSLKSGDLINITNPSHVNIIHNGKIIFKGTAGKADSNKVIKINQSI